MILSIDPGLRDLGGALWKDGRLTGAFLAQNKVEVTRGMAAYRGMAMEVETHLIKLLGERSLNGVVFERMVVYVSAVHKARDLLQLAGVTGAISMTLPMTMVEDKEFYGLEPGRWTGGRKKPGNHFRIWNRLDGKERQALDGIDGLTLPEIEELVEAGQTLTSDINHVFDAVGLGLYHLERL